jgi:transketolase
MELESVLDDALRGKSPAYIRIGKKGEPVVHPKPPKLKMGEPVRLAKGKDVALISCGTILPEVIRAAELLKKKGISASVYSQPYLKPFPDKPWAAIFRSHHSVVSVEEHSRLGGLGGCLAEWRAGQKKGAALVRVGTKDEFLHRTTDQEGARKHFQHNAEGICKSAQNSLRA